MPVPIIHPKQKIGTVKTSCPSHPWPGKAPGTATVQNATHRMAKATPKIKPPRMDPFTLNSSSSITEPHLRPGFSCEALSICGVSPRRLSMKGRFRITPVVAYARERIRPLHLRCESIGPHGAREQSAKETGCEHPPASTSRKAPTHLYWSAICPPRSWQEHPDGRHPQRSTRRRRSRRLGAICLEGQRRRPSPQVQNSERFQLVHRPSRPKRPGAGPCRAP